MIFFLASGYCSVTLGTSEAIMPSINNQPNTIDKSMANIKINALDILRESTTTGCKFISFLYMTKGTGETSRYTLNFGIDYKAACEADKASLEAFEPQSDVEAQAKEQMLVSLTETLTQGVSSSYTQKDTFDHIGKGIRQHKETGEIYLYGFVQQKEQVAPAINPKKPVNSRPLTLAKRNIEKVLDFKRNRFGQFILNPENIAGVKVCGDLIELH